jgi:hypothetical protein
MQTGFVFKLASSTFAVCLLVGCASTSTLRTSSFDAAIARCEKERNFVSCIKSSPQYSSFNQRQLDLVKAWNELDADFKDGLFSRREYEQRLRAIAAYHEQKS